MRFAKLAKLAFGGSEFSADELGSVLNALGMQIAMRQITFEEAPIVLRTVALAAARKGASLHRLSGHMPGGETLEALIVLVPEKAAEEKACTFRKSRAIVADV